MTEPRDDPDPMMAYKVLLRDCLDRRPSGLRQKLAAALGKHKSFITQITSPTYSVPIPVGDLPTIFEICHLSPEEQERFLKHYEAAHPGRATKLRRAANLPHELRIAIPAFASEATARDVEATILEIALRIIRLAQRAEQLAADGGPPDEEVRQRRR